VEEAIGEAIIRKRWCESIWRLNGFNSELGGNLSKNPSIHQVDYRSAGGGGRANLHHARYWYVHIASAFAWDHHYKAVPGWRLCAGLT